MRTRGPGGYCFLFAFPALLFHAKKITLVAGNINTKSPESNINDKIPAPNINTQIGLRMHPSHLWAQKDGDHIVQ